MSATCNEEESVSHIYTHKHTYCQVNNTHTHSMYRTYGQNICHTVPLRSVDISDFLKSMNAHLHLPFVLLSNPLEYQIITAHLQVKRSVEILTTTKNPNQITTLDSRTQQHYLTRKYPILIFFHFFFSTVQFDVTLV